MRRILFILFLCVHGVAWGQIPYEYRYWYDGDETTAKSGTSASSAWQLRLDVSDLDDTFHMLYFQVKDTADVWSAPLSRCFVKLPLQGESTVTYWFDNAPSRKHTLQATTGTTTIDVSGLSDGMHFLHLVAGNPASPHSSLVKTAVFWKQAIPTQCKYRLWVDDDASSMQEGIYTGQPIEVNVGAASDGFHLLRAQVEGSAASSPLTSMFIKVPQTKGVDRLTCIFLVDGKEYKKESVPAEGGVVKWTFDAQGISHGLHKAQAMVVTPSGAATAVKDAYFYRAMTTAEKGAMRCFYSIDGSEHRMEAGRLDNNLFHFDLDVADVPDGFHRISYMLMGENGTSSKVMSAFFFKTALGGNGVMQYDYWLNENEANTRKVKLDKRENPFKLISLLPVETCPIRSAKFHLEVEDGQPVLYAKNDFHVRFYDASSRMTEATKDYVDYQVRRPVEDIEALGPLDAGTVSCEKPAENDIRWFKLEAKIGDSLAIKTSKAATLQIFSPTGREVYRTEGAGSVAFGGCHAYEDGTHYVALHDVTASNVTTLDLSYQHIDKYAVLDYDVNRVGNAGLTTITFEGNGFHSLESIDLVNSAGDTIESVYIAHDFDHRIQAMFDFNGRAVGDYDMFFHFLDEDRSIPAGLRVEEAKDVALETVVKYPNRYLRNGTVTYTVKITNKGNNTAYQVPVYAYMATRTEKGISHTQIGGVQLPGFYDYVDLSDYTEAERQEMLSHAAAKGHGHLFIRQYVKTEDAKDSIFVRSGIFNVDIAPRSTKTISFTMTANEEMDVWVTVPTDWKTFSDISVASPRKAKRNAVDAFCCYKDRIECVGNIVGNVSFIANKITSVIPCPYQKAVEVADCAIGMINKTISAAGTVFCDEENEVESKFWEKLNQMASVVDASSVIASCLKSALKLDVEAWNLLNDVLTISGPSAITTAGNCITAFTTPVQNCPPAPPGGGSSTPVNSFDPNDIYGYKAESGSKAIKKDLKEVYYTIEFENDPEFATASAHEVVIRDTLDGKRFDLTTFRPTSLKIGDRSMELDGEQSTIVSMDVRPEINAIVQMELDYDAKKGIATWKFTSLDPMTMERTDNLMSGFLPVNNEAGDGIGQVAYDISLLDGLGDGVTISNRASIVFDTNDPIITPTWTNVTDTVAPTSEIRACEMLNDSTMTLRFKGTDNRSGVWTYDLYVQDGPEAPWQKVAESIADSVYEFKGYTGIDYGFCVMATDSAGNYELKALARELTQPTYKKGDANGDGVVNTTDAMLAIDKYLGNTVYLNVPATDVNGDGIINTNDAMLIQEIYLNTSNAKMKTKAVRRRLKTNNL